MSIRIDNKFALAQKVYLAGDDKAWFITGVRAKIGYDLFLWEYDLTRHHYGDYEFDGFGARSDTQHRPNVPEDSIRTMAVHKSELEKRLAADIDYKRNELAKLEFQLAQTKGANEQP